MKTRLISVVVLQRPRYSISPVLFSFISIHIKLKFFAIEKCEDLSKHCYLHDPVPFKSKPIPLRKICSSAKTAKESFYVTLS